MRFENRICAVTGAGSGIGRHLALALAAQGAVVAVSDIDADSAQETARLVESAGPGRAEATRLDVTDADAVRAWVDDLAARHGRLDLMINNAGIAIGGDARDLELAHWRRVIDVNQMGVLHGCDAAYKLMARQGEGHIVNISSLSGLVPFPSNVPYGTTKFAVVGLSLGLRAEGEDLGVRVSAVCPGFVESNIYTASESLHVDSAALSADLPFRKVPTAVAAQKILRGIERNQAVIVFPGYARFVWWLFRLDARLLAPQGRDLIRKFRKLRMVP